MVGLDVGNPVLGERVLGKPVGTAVGVRVGVCELNSVTLLDANVGIKVGAKVGAKVTAVAWRKLVRVRAYVYHCACLCECLYNSQPDCAAPNSMVVAV